VARWERIPRVTESRLPARPAWLATLVFASAAAVLVAVAGQMIFSTFMYYDDEGYVLLSLRNFAAHGGLYRDVYTQYGPFPYVIYYALHALGLPLTHTAGRLLTLAAWSGTALLCAALVRQATRSLVSSLAVLASVFLYLWVMASEPTHPGGMITVLTVALATLGYYWISTGRIHAWAIAVGAGVATLVLTKINVGAFAALSMIAWVLLHHRNNVVRRWAPWILVVGGALLPFALMRPLLDTAWVQIYAVVFACSAIAAIAAAARAPEARVGWSPLGWGALGAGVVAAVVLGVVFARGTTPADLLDGVLLGPLRLPKSFSLWYRWPPAIAYVALVSLAACVAACWLRRRGTAFVEVVVAVLRIAATVGLVSALCRFPTISPDNLVFAFAMPCLWLFLWPLPDENGSAAARTWVGLLFLGQCLHPFPVAGSQIAWGTVLALPLAALGAWNAAAWLGERFSRSKSRGWRAEILALRLAVASFAVLMGWRLAEVGNRYYDGSDLELPGAESLRLPSDATALFRVLTLNATVHGDMLFSEPGMFSLNLWSGLPTPTLANVTHWFSLLNPARQQAIIRELEAHPRACVIVQRDHVKFLNSYGFAPAGPLHDYLAKNFAPAFTLDGFEFCVRLGRHIQPLMLAELLTLAPAAAQELPRAEDTLLRTACLLPTGRAVASLELAAPGDPSGKPLILNAADARVEITPANLRGEPVGATAARTWPFTLSGPAIVSVYFNREGRPRPSRGALIVLRASDGTELALARLEQ
jgi:hypothetical protein